MRDEVLAPYPRTEGEVRQHMAEYYAMIAHLDDAIGRILETLDKQELRENSIIIFAGDNGLALGQHGLFGKQSAYEHSIRVPLIFSGPGIPAGKKQNDLCYLFDIFPTLMELMEIDTPETVEGLSLKASIVGESGQAQRKELYFAYENKLRAVKTGGYKLIEYAGPDFRQTQLFHLDSDPWEKKNLAPLQQEKVKEMRESFSDSGMSGMISITPGVKSSGIITKWMFMIECRLTAL
ncbi:MAG: sulfatase-like hydrolase/transferase [Spirochaetales bacterium]|nr:sulfatase-like hydrolase/transferase [Spirochaetales bacterium]